MPAIRAIIRTRPFSEVVDWLRVLDEDWPEELQDLRIMRGENLVAPREDHPPVVFWILRDRRIFMSTRRPFTEFYVDGVQRVEYDPCPLEDSFWWPRTMLDIERKTSGEAHRFYVRAGADPIVLVNAYYEYMSLLLHGERARLTERGDLGPSEYEGVHRIFDARLLTDPNFAEQVRQCELADWLKRRGIPDDIEILNVTSPNGSQIDKDESDEYARKTRLLSPEPDCPKAVYTLLLFYKVLIRLLNAFWAGEVGLADDALNRNYLRLRVRIDEILKRRDFAGLSAMAWRPLEHLVGVNLLHEAFEGDRSFWRSNCAAFLSAVEEAHVRLGEKSHRLDDKDREALSKVGAFLEERKRTYAAEQANAGADASTYADGRIPKKGLHLRRSTSEVWCEGVRVGLKDRTREPFEFLWTLCQKWPQTASRRDMGCIDVDAGRKYLKRAFRKAGKEHYFDKMIETVRGSGYRLKDSDEPRLVE